MAPILIISGIASNTVNQDYKTKREQATWNRKTWNISSYKCKLWVSIISKWMWAQEDGKGNLNMDK